MGQTASGTRRLAELERVALDATLPPVQRGRAASELARSLGTLPPPIAAARLESVVELHERDKWTPARIARAFGLSPLAGRISQLLKDHRTRSAEASDATA